MNAFIGSASELLHNMWPGLAAGVHILLAVTTSIHVVLTKEDTKAATAWVGLVWLSPFLGAAMYYVLGINRIRRKAVSIREGAAYSSGFLAHPPSKLPTETHFEALIALGERLSGRPLTSGNTVTPLINGDEAYPDMLRDIRNARTSISLSSYIFDNDSAGQRFLDALSEAHERGVHIRVLIDATGARYSFPSITKPLRQRGIKSALFMPNLSLKKMGTINLRSHRKLLVVDGRIGFTGGMNIREGNLLATSPRHPIQDLHFRCEGPIVRHIQEAFLEDWAFTTGEQLAGESWLPEQDSKGTVLARGILDGPDENYEKILFIILGAISRAKKSIRILTPYFLPDQTTIRMLSIAAMAGVEVDIVIPEENNILLVQWASMATVGPLLRHGVRIHLSKPPFDHSKLVLVDESWVFVGSANLDSRSLQLNFEFNIECYSPDLARDLSRIFTDKVRKSRNLTLSEVQGRALPTKVRDGVVRLLGPYL